MISFSLSIFLGLLGIAVLLVGILATFALYHLWSYGATYRVAFLSTIIFVVGLIAILGGTRLALQGTDWQAPISISVPGLGSLSAPADSSL